MKSYAECFRKTFRPERCESSIPRLAGTERINVIIFGLKNTTLIPYILYLAKNVQKETEQNKIYQILPNYPYSSPYVKLTVKKLEGVHELI